MVRFKRTWKKLHAIDPENRKYILHMRQSLSLENKIAEIKADVVQMAEKSESVAFGLPTTKQQLEEICTYND